MTNAVNRSMLAFLILILFSSFSFAQWGEGLNLERLGAKLKLSDTQKDQIEKLRIGHQKAMVDLKAKLDKARIELREVTSKADFSRSEYLASHTKMAKFREEIQLAAANHRMDVLELMTQEQRKILSEERLDRKGQNKFWKKGRGDCGMERPKMNQRKRIHW
jgi:Spy/CpxP family protein refolding chaperone